MDAAYNSDEDRSPADDYVEKLHEEQRMLIRLVESLMAEVDQYKAKLAEGKQQIDELQEMVKA